MRVEADQAKAEWAKAGGATRALRYELRQLEQQQRAVDSAMTAMGIGVAGAGVAIGAGLTVASRAAIQWESAWTGVAKVVDGSPEEMAALEEELRGLATTLPQTHGEIAAVAAAAGQLGVAKEDIAQFTETMVAMGVATDLSSEDAAMGMARLMNIMQSGADDVDNLGSAIVGLGNSGASTEGEILEMALRIAGAGHTIGLTEADVLALSSALASVGVEAESGGSSISTAMVMMSEAVNEGGDSLESFARVAGVTADEFAAKFRTDPAVAIDMFVQGLGRIQSSGGDVFATMEELGMTEIRLRDNMLRLAGAGTLLTDSLATGNAAWDENTALMAEAERRYGTTEAQIAIAKNQLVDMGITLGEILLPAINNFLDVGDGLFSWFQSMPAGLQQTVVWLGVVTATITLAGGAALAAVPKFHALSVALGEIGTKKAVRLQGALGSVASVLTGPWGIAIGGAIAVLGIFAAEQAKTQAETDELSATFDAQTGAVTENTRAWLANKLQSEGAFDAAKEFGISQSELVDAVINGTDVLAEQKAYYDELRAASGETGDEFRQMTDEEWNQADAVDYLDSQINDLTGQYDEAAGAAENKAAAINGDTAAMSSASTATRVYAADLGISALAAEDATAANQEFDAALQALRDTIFGSRDAQAALTLEIQRATEAFEENGSSLDVNSEAGALNHQAVMGLIAANHELIAAEAESGASAEELAATTADLRGDFIDLMRQAGFSEEAIDDYAKAFDNIPSSKTTVLVQELKTIGQWNVPSNGILPQYATGGLIGFPTGGMISGPGTGTSDSILIAASNGEFMVNAEATARNRPLLEAINSGEQIATATKATGAYPRRQAVSSGGGVHVWFDFANVSGSLERAIKDSVRVNGSGDVQIAFGSK